MKMGEKLQGLQEEKHQLFLQLKKVIHEEEKRHRKEQRLSLASVQEVLNIGSTHPARQHTVPMGHSMPPPKPLASLSLSAMLAAPKSEGHQHFRPCSTSLTSSRAMLFTVVHSQPGFIPSAGIPLQKQLEHANQQSGFMDSTSFQSSSQLAPHHAYLSHTQTGQRFYHHTK
ncbi:hypothetical protein AAFF_G00327110 [Aldrovandia affinis]|uniref:G protein pathway suppressor 2 n=1 Tax=Aldrovandia affinis TaxID=143900 RepID=A0AAD7X1L8_9TELE|nr:hypothetical protein AAFF_G00327110 [Aldrovandia affinis]